MNTIDPINADPRGSLVPQSEREATQRKNKTHPNFVRFIHETTSDIKNKDSVGYRRRHKRWMINWLFYNGEQYGFWDDDSGTYQTVEPNSRRKFYINNHLSSFIDATQKEWARSKTELTVHPADDRPESAGAARIASHILAHYQRKLRNPIDHQEEGLIAAMCGSYFRYSYFSTNAVGGMGRWPQIEKTSVKIAPDAFLCQCGNAGSVEELIPSMDGTSNCAECGNPNVQIIESPTTEVDQVSGYEERPRGDIVSENVDPFEIKLHPKARSGRVESSPYLYRERRVHRAVLEDVFPNIDVPKFGETLDDGYGSGLKEQKWLERSAGNVSEGNRFGNITNNRDADDDTVIFRQIWLDPPLYGRYTFPEDTTVGDGIQIPKDTPLKELFPDGLYIGLIGNNIVDVRNENKNKHWVAGVYRILPTSFWGRGIEDAVWQQRLLNDVYNLMVEYLKRCSVPTVLYNSLMIEPGSFGNQPGELIPVENGGPDVPLDRLYLQVPAPNLPAHIPNFIEQCKRDMQTQIGAFSTLTGAPDVDITTATGIKLLREASVALIAMALAIKAEVDAIWGQQILELAKDNLLTPQAFPVNGQYGQQEIKWFSSVDIAAQLVVSYAEHSVIPRSEVERRNDVIDAMAAGNVPLGIWNPQMPAELRRLLSERFNIPYAADNFAQVERQARIRLEQIKQLVEEALQAVEVVGEGYLMPDPETGMIPAVMEILQRVRINPKLDDHDTHMQFIRNWFLEDDGLFATDLMQAVMEARFDEHFQAKIMVAQMNSQASVMAQAPEMMAAAEMGATTGGAALPSTKPSQPPPGEKIAPPASPAV